MELQLANTVSKVLVLLFKSLYQDIEFFLQTFAMISCTKPNHSLRSSNNCEKQHQNQCKRQTLEAQEKISFVEMNMMMNRLGMPYRFEGINEDASFGAQDVVSLFEEEEPSLDEIKETFRAFDVNNDGFIDAGELHRVVCNLGLKERFELEECKRMIKASDSNGDGLIDFHEFVKFMEKCFC